MLVRHAPDAQPGLGLPVLVPDRIDVKGRRKAPQPVLHVQESVVLQVIVHVGDQQVEYQAAPKLAHILDGRVAVGADGVCDLCIATIIFA